MFVASLLFLMNPFECHKKKKRETTMSLNLNLAL